MNSENNNGNNEIETLDFLDTPSTLEPSVQPTNTNDVNVPAEPMNNVPMEPNMAPISNEVPNEPNVVTDPVNVDAPSAPVDSVEPTVDPNAEPTQVLPSLQAMADADASNISYDTKDAYNEFSDSKPRKKKSPMLAILLVVLILGAACGGYYVFFVLKGNNNPAGGGTQSITTKDVVIELNDEIPQNITAYINKDLKQTEYKLLNKGINNNEVGEYEYTVVYNNNKYTGKAIVKDTKAPELIVKNIIANSTSNLTVNDFVSSCTDLSGCSYEISGEPLTTYTADGEYELLIKAKDNYDNETVKKATLTLNAGITINKLICTRTVESESINGTKKFVVSMDFDENNNIKKLVNELNISFKTATDYNNFKKDTDNTGTFNVSNYSYYKSDEYDATTIIAAGSPFAKVPTEKTATSTFFTDRGYTCK